MILMKNILRYFTNHNISAKKEKYKDLVPKWCEIRCGEKFTLLRDEFLRDKEVKRGDIYEYFYLLWWG